MPKTNDEKKDPYKVLGVRRDAKKEVVESAYRVLRRQFHPDNTETGNTEKWNEVQVAYEAITNEITKAVVPFSEQTGGEVRVISVRAALFRKFEVDEGFLRSLVEKVITSKQYDWTQSREPLEILALFAGGAAFVLNAYQVWQINQFLFGGALFLAAVEFVGGAILSSLHFPARSHPAQPHPFTIDDLIKETEKREGELKTS